MMAAQCAAAPSAKRRFKYLEVAHTVVYRCASKSKQVLKSVLKQDMALTNASAKAGTDSHAEQMSWIEHRKRKSMEKVPVALAET